MLPMVKLPPRKKIGVRLCISLLKLTRSVSAPLGKSKNVIQVVSLPQERNFRSGEGVTPVLPLNNNDGCNLGLMRKNMGYYGNIT